MMSAQYISPPSRSPAQDSFTNGLLPPCKKKYGCATCGRTFTTSGHLARHGRIHTGERNHACPFPGCETRCSRQDNLQQHYRIHLSPGSRRTTGSATRAAMHRAMDQSRRSTSASSPPSESTSPSHYMRSPTMDEKPELKYSHSLASPVPSSRPAPPETPPPLECAYATPRATPSLSNQSSERSSPELSPYSQSYSALHPSSRLAPTFSDVNYHSAQDRKANACVGFGGPKASLWEPRSRSVPDSPECDDISSPIDNSAHTYTDSDEAPSPASSASSHQHDTTHNYDYYNGHPSTQHMPSPIFTSDRQHTSFVEPATRQPSHVYYHQHSYSSSSPVSPAVSQPPSPTYATSPVNAYGHGFGSDTRSVVGAFVRPEAAGIQSSYSGNSMPTSALSPTHTHPSRTQHSSNHAIPSVHAPAASSPTQRYSSQVYGHATSTHGRSPSNLMLAPIHIDSDRAVRNSDPRQAERRLSMSYVPGDQLRSHQAVPNANDRRPQDDYDVDGDSPVQELSSPLGSVQQAHTQQAQQSGGHLPYSYSSYNQTWSADAMRSRATLVH